MRQLESNPGAAAGGSAPRHHLCQPSGPLWAYAMGLRPYGKTEFLG
jgi:hypothetical protein